MTALHYFPFHEATLGKSKEKIDGKSTYEQFRKDRVDVF